MISTTFKLKHQDITLKANSYRVLKKHLLIQSQFENYEKRILELSGHVSNVQSISDDFKSGYERRGGQIGDLKKTNRLLRQEIVGTRGQREIAANDAAYLFAEKKVAMGGGNTAGIVSSDKCNSEN